MMVVMSITTTQAGAATTTLLNLTLEQCAAYAVEAPQAKLTRARTTTLVAMVKEKLEAMMEQVAKAMLVHVLTQTWTVLAILSETLTEITAMSTMTIQAGAETTTLKISSPEKCAAHAMVAPQAALIKAKMITLVVMKEKTRVKEMKEKKTMAALKTILMMDPQEKLEYASMMISEAENR